MPNVIVVKLNVSKIDKSKLFKGAKGMYLDIVLIPSTQSNYGDERDENTHMVCQSVTKAERDAGVRGPILGNARELVGQRDRRPPPTTPEQSKADSPDSDDVPF